MRDRATRDWNTFGETEPYFAVLTHDRFLSEQMSAADREAFFAFGEADIAQIFDLIDIAPKSALDFGCGVGRLTRALVKRVDRVAGVDAAESMLRIARENVPNATFSTAIPNERFDLIVSLLVFQHIPIRRGEALLGDLLDGSSLQPVREPLIMGTRRALGAAHLIVKGTGHGSKIR